MKTTMTENDKRLLTIMFMFVIIVGIGYWGIWPQIKQYNNLATKIEKEEEKKKINQMKMANLGAVTSLADGYEEKIAALKDQFYPIMTSSEVDRMMTEIAVRNNLEIYDLKFSMPTTPSKRLAYKNSTFYPIQQQMIADYKKTAAKKNKTASTTTTEEEDEDDSKASSSKSSSKSETKTTTAAVDSMGEEEGGYHPNTDVYAVPVTITVGGELSDLHSFINEFIETDKRILLVSYAWGVYKITVKRDADGNIIETKSVAVSDKDSDNTAGVTAEELDKEVKIKKTLTIKVEIYMCDTEDVSE